MTDDLRPKFESAVKDVEGDLLATLTALGEDGWQVVQLLPQPAGVVKVLVQRRKLLVETDVRTLSLVPR